MLRIRGLLDALRNMPSVKADDAWQELGALEPYFAVLTNPDFLRANVTPERLQEFFASGEREVRNLLREAQSLFPLDLPLDRVLDFGCGVGRLTIPLAGSARHVLAVDAADSMLARARMHCEAARVRNVEFLTLKEAWAVPPASIHLACAHLVLQHVPTSSGERILRHLLSLVAPGGLCSVDITFFRSGSRSRGVGRWFRARSRLVHAAASVLRGKPGLPYMQMNTYDLGSVLRSFSGLGFSRSIVTVSSDGPLLTARILSRRDPG